MGCKEQPNHRRRRRRRPFFSLVARGFASHAQQAIPTGSDSEYRGRKRKSCAFGRGTRRPNPFMLVEYFPRASDQFGRPVP